MKKTIYLRARSLLRSLCAFLVLLFVASGCSEDFQGYYDYPSNLEGALYEQIAARPEFSEFTKAIDKLPLLQRAIDKSGLYTIFVPTNDAIAEFFADPDRQYFKEYSSIDDFDVSKNADSLALSHFLDAHILYDMYFEYSFKSAISSTPANLELASYGSRENNRYVSRYKPAKYQELDVNSPSQRVRWVRPDNTRVRIFTKKYLDKYLLNDQYEVLFGVAPGDFNIGAAQVLANTATTMYRDIPAKNGAIHTVNKVLTPSENLEAILKREGLALWQMFQNFTTYTYSANATDTEGKEVNDSIFTKRYSLYDFTNEGGQTTILIPPDAEFNAFMDQVLAGFDNDLDSLPRMISSYLGSTYFLAQDRNESDMLSGVLNATGDTLTTNPNPLSRFWIPIELDPGKRFVASNGYAYVLQDIIVASAFSTALQVPMSHKDYGIMLKVLAYSGNANYLIGKGYKTTLFVGKNDAFAPLGIFKEYLDAGQTDQDGTSWKISWKDKNAFTNQLDSLSKYMSFNLLDDESETYTLTPDMLHAPGYHIYRTRSGNFMKIVNGEIITIDPDVFGLEFGIPIPAEGANTVETENGWVYTIPMIPVQPKYTISGWVKAMNQVSYAGTYPNKFKHLWGLMQQSLPWLDTTVPNYNLYKNNTATRKFSDDLDKFTGNNMFTFFAPSDEAIEAYALAKGGQAMKNLIVAGTYSDATVKALFGPALWNLVVTTRVYSIPGVFVQNGENPMAELEDDVLPSQFVTVLPQIVRQNGNLFENNENGWLRVSYEDGAMYIKGQDPQEPNIFINQALKDVETMNGVIHQIDAFPTLPVKQFPDDEVVD